MTVPKELTHMMYRHIYPVEHLPIREPKVFLQDEAQGNWTRYPNELFDRLLYGGSSPQEFLLASCVVRQTYGWLHRNFVIMSLREAADISGMSVSTVKRCLSSLKEKGILGTYQHMPGDTNGMGFRYPGWGRVWDNHY